MASCAVRAVQQSALCNWSRITKKVTMELAEMRLQLNINHAGTPVAGLLKMFEDQLHTDITFQVGGQRVCAHRIVLASQSDYFECLLYGPMMEGRASEVTLKDTPADAFRELLKFVYSGSISSMNLTTALDLHILADRFGFSYLKDGVEAHLTTIVSVENVLPFYSHAQVSSAVQLKEQCETFMDQNARAVIRSEAVPYLPKEIFIVLIARDTFVVEELEIFNAVQRWIAHNDDDGHETLDLLQCVRLTEIPRNELKTKVLPSGLYKREQVLQAMGVRENLDKDCISTRGKKGENLNLFKEEGTKLLTCTNYLLDVLPDKTDNWSCVCDLIFTLAVSASEDPAYITVKFDDVYIVNQLSFNGYSDLASLTEASRENSPFCYQIWVSRDGDQWVTILDYSRLKCYSIQRLFFAKMAIRYVRILQTRGREKFTIHLESCSYVGPVPHNFRELGVIAPFIPLRPDFRHFVRFSETCYQARVFITFTQPYSINIIRFRLHGLEGSGDVAISVATENRSKRYQLMTELKDADLRPTLQAEFQERPVSIISIDLSNFKLPNKGTSPSLGSPIPQFIVHDLVCQATE